MNEQREALKKIIEESENIVFFGGAGVSTESGIPDFRSENGIFKTVQEYGIPPETIISASYFWQDQRTFYDYYKKNLVAQWAKPNKAHLALAKLEEIGKLKAVVTQNIDGLHQAAGSKTVYELHGSIHRNYCRHCGKFYTLDQIMDEAKCENGVPRCTCGSIIKPDVVLYEENLDDTTVSNAVSAIRKADTLIVGGTSLVVYPAAGFVGYFRGKHLVVINKGETGIDSEAELVIREPIGEVLGEVVGV